jgi:hypothetical protein
MFFKNSYFKIILKYLLFGFVAKYGQYASAGKNMSMISNLHFYQL